MLFAAFFTENKLGNVQAVIINRYPFRPGLNIESCAENRVGAVILYLLVGLGFLIMLIGLFFAFLTRKFPFLAFNESKIILYSVAKLMYTHRIQNNFGFIEC